MSRCRQLGPVLTVVAAVAACTSPGTRDEEQQPDPSVEETEVYLQTLKPPEVFSVRFREPLRYDVINVKYVYLDVLDGRFLVEMERYCKPLKSNEIYADMADRRSIRGRLRAGIDTIRGCRIKTIYELPREPATATEAETPTGENGQTEAAEAKLPPPD